MSGDTWGGGGRAGTKELILAATTPTAERSRVWWRVSCRDCLDILDAVETMETELQLINPLLRLPWRRHRRRMLMSFRNLRFPSKKEEGEGKSS